jgi:hypothetical protein
VIVHARIVTQPVLQEFERQLAGDIAYIYTIRSVLAGKPPRIDLGLMASRIIESIRGRTALR